MSSCNDATDMFISDALFVNVYVNFSSRKKKKNLTTLGRCRGCGSALNDSDNSYYLESFGVTTHDLTGVAK